jgi:hypothetical protein
MNSRDLEKGNKTPITFVSSKFQKERRRQSETGFKEKNWIKTSQADKIHKPIELRR